MSSTRKMCCLSFGSNICVCVCVCLYFFTLLAGMTPEEAFINSSESITGPITKKISKEGILKVYQDLNAADKAIFEQAYSSSYKPARSVPEFLVTFLFLYSDIYFHCAFYFYLIFCSAFVMSLIL
jgi:hypothetical protein